MPRSKSNSDHSCRKWPRIDYHESMVPLGATDTEGFSIHSQPLSNDLHGTTRKIGQGWRPKKVSPWCRLGDAQADNENDSNHPIEGGEQLPHHLDRQETTP